MNDDFKEAINDIVRPLVMVFTFIYLALVLSPFFVFSENLLRALVVDDVFFVGWWIVLLFWFGVIIVALWMLIMVKMGLRE